MATPWENPIRKAKQLTICPGATIAKSTWATILPNAVTEFNALATANSLGVTFAQVSTPPDPNGPAGADVLFETANGAVTFVSFGTTFSLTVDGSALIGHTQTVRTVIKNVEKIAKAFIFVPATPQGGSGKSKREVGPGVKLVMLVHEMIHACGLSNGDHGNDDVFFGFPQLRMGSKAADDKLEASSTAVMPPIVMSANTAKLIQSVW